MLFIGFWWTLLVWFVATNYERVTSERQRQKNLAWMLRSPHLAPGEPWMVVRVSKKLGVIARRWTGERAA